MYVFPCEYLVRILNCSKSRPGFGIKFQHKQFQLFANNKYISKWTANRTNVQINGKLLINEYMYIKFTNTHEIIQEFTHIRNYIQTYIRLAV